MRQLYTDVSALQNTNHTLAKTNTNEVAGFNRKAAVEIDGQEFTINFNDRMNEGNKIKIDAGTGAEYVTLGSYDENKNGFNFEYEHGGNTYSCILKYDDQNGWQVEIGEVKSEYQENSAEADRETAGFRAEQQPIARGFAPTPLTMATASFNIPYQPPVPVQIIQIDLAELDEPPELKSAEPLTSETVEEILEENDVDTEKLDIEVDEQETIITGSARDVENSGLTQALEENNIDAEVETTGIINRTTEVTIPNEEIIKLADDPEVADPPVENINPAQRTEPQAAQTTQRVTDGQVTSSQRSINISVAGTFGGTQPVSGSTSEMRVFNWKEESIGRDVVLEMKDDPERGYEIFTTAISRSKNNTKDIDSIVSAVSAALREAASHYETDVYESWNIDTGEIASSPQETFKLWLSAEGEVSNTICGTIHGTVMQALNDCGIEAAVVNTVTGDANAMHYTLMYKVGEGQYIFNNYGNSVSVAAPNVLEAIKSVQKNNQTGDHSDGFVSICNTQGNMTEYALTDIAVFGSEVDKYSGIMKSLSAEEQRRARGLYISADGNVTQEEFAAKLGYTWNTKNGDISLDIGAQKNGDSNMANESQSFGLKLNAFSQYETSLGRLGLERTVIASNTNLTTGGGDNTYNHNIITAAFSGRTFFDIDFFNNTAGRLTFRTQAEANIAAGIVSSNDEDMAGVNGGMADVGLNLGGGLNYTNTIGRLIFAADVGARGLLNYNRTFVNSSIFELKFDNTGYQVAGGLSIGSSNQQGFVWNVGANTAYMRDANQSRFSAAGELNLGWLNPTGTSINGTLGAEYRERNISGMFNETIYQDLVLSAGVDVTLKDSVTLFANASQKVNLLVDQAFELSPEVTLGIKLRPKW
ncbi:MAG: hypothetical protein LBK68_02215 [Candidatus Margulisbacteria bacterium]|jgi:nitrogen regulatory protein PII|nr:hypothetical protein [Candidatus Margulisiibacteriota bacterium]